MNTTITSAADLAAELVERAGGCDHADVILFPPFPNLETVHRIISGSNLALGAQDVFWEAAGAYTGEVSAGMLIATGCKWVIVGHSERRRILGESNAVVNRKLHAALDGGLRVILAVGETREERAAGGAEAVLRAQLEESFAGVPAEIMDKLVLAYEPVWAIGTGETASPDQARDAHAFLRSVLLELYGREIARDTRIQYGGSVTRFNAAELLSEPGIDGALVGGASLKVDEFVAIVEAVPSSGARRH